MKIRVELRPGRVGGVVSANEKKEKWKKRKNLDGKSKNWVKSLIGQK
jgi:hypothetical protein